MSERQLGKAYYTLAEAARLLGVSYPTVRNMVTAIPVRGFRRRMVLRQELARLLEENEIILPAGAQRDIDRLRPPRPAET